MAKSKAPRIAASTRATIGKRLELATRQNSIDFAYFGGALPNPDPVLKKMGKDITVYDELRGDAHLGAVISQRKSGVKSLLWEIDRGKAKSRQAKAIAAHFQTLPVADIISEIMDAILYGYQPLEVVWGPTKDGLITPLKVVGKPPEWFMFNEDNQLRWRSKLNPFLGEEIPPRKFLLPRHNATYKNPYGEPLLSRCYWPVTFKRSGIKFWITFVEKYGMPWPVGKLPRNAGENEYNALKNNLEAMVQDALAVIPDDASIELMESGSKTGSADVFQGIIKWANDEMSKAILGHSGAADSTPGKLGGEDNTIAVRGDLVAEDKRMVEEVFNELIRWICEINFGSVEPPKFVLYAEEDVDQAQATRDKTLYDQGVRLSADYYSRTYGFQDGDILEVQAGPAPAAPIGTEVNAFAEAKRVVTKDQAAIDSAIEAVTKPEDLRREAAMAQQIMDVFASSGDFSEAMEKAIGLYPTLDIEAVREKVGNAIFLSGVVGRLSAQGEA